MSSDEATQVESETKNESSNSQEVSPAKDSDSSSSDSGDEEKEAASTDNQNASKENNLDENITSENVSSNQEVDKSTSPSTPLDDAIHHNDEDSVLDTSTTNNETTPSGELEPSPESKESEGDAIKYYDDIIKKYSDDDDGDDEESDDDDDKNKYSDSNIAKDLSKVNENDLINASEDQTKADPEDELEKDSKEEVKQDSVDNLENINDNKDNENVLAKTSHDSSSSDSEEKVKRDSIEEVKLDSENNLQNISDNKDDENILTKASHDTSSSDSEDKENKASTKVLEQESENNLQDISANKDDENALIKTSHDTSSSDSDDEVKKEDKDEVKEDCEEKVQNITNSNKSDENYIQKSSQDSSSSDSEDEIKEKPAGVEKKDSVISKLDQKTVPNVVPSPSKQNEKIKGDSSHNKSPVHFTAHKFQNVHNTESPRKYKDNNPMASFLRKELEDQARKEQELKAAGTILTLSEDRVDERVIRGAQSVSPQVQTPVEDDKTPATPTRPTLVKTPSRLFKEMEEANAKEKELKTQGKISTLSEDTVDEKVIRTSDIGKIPPSATPSYKSSNKRTMQVGGAHKSPKGSPVVLSGRAPKGMMQKFINSNGKMKTEGFTAPRPV